jgi:glutaredoxin 3
MRYLAPFFLALMTFLAPTQAAMPNVVIYTIPGCLGCRMVISMFEDRGIPYKEIDVAGNRSVYMAMVSKTGGKRTVPQVFINDKYIGGYSDISGSDLDALVKDKKPDTPSEEAKKSEGEDENKEKPES